LRVLRNRRNRRAPASSNRAVAHARGTLIKFLDADDVLEPHCLQTMVDRFAERPDVDMVFFRRGLLVMAPDDEYVKNWIGRFGDVAAKFGHLEPYTPGPELFSRWAAGGLSANWIGEPLTVMVRRAVLERAGGFNEHIRQRFDLDLWSRVLPSSRQVGFVDEPLGSYRVSGPSLTSRNHALHLEWLDHPWMFEGLRCHPQFREIAPRLPELEAAERAWVRHELRELFRRSVPARRVRLTDGVKLGLWLVARRVRPGATPYRRIGPPPASADSGQRNGQARRSADRFAAGRQRSGA
jgi:glycosyltransferase involved in cell wall biosynthesis